MDFHLVVYRLAYGIFVLCYFQFLSFFLKVLEKTCKIMIIFFIIKFSMKYFHIKCLRYGYNSDFKLSIKSRVITYKVVNRDRP